MDIFTKSKRRQIMAAIRSRDTKPELMVRKILHALGYRFRLHKKELPGSPDIVLARYKAVIFVHGCFWHGHKCNRAKLPSSNTAFWTAKIIRNKVRDKEAKRLLKVAGWRVLIIWQCQLKNDKRIRGKLTTFLSN